MKGFSSTIVVVLLCWATWAEAVSVQYFLGADDYGDLYIDGQLKAHYDDYPQGGDWTDVLDLSPGWHDIQIIFKNRWGSSSIALGEITEPTQTTYTYVPREKLRCKDASDQWVDGLRADYFTLDGVYITTVYGEGPIHHVSGRWYEDIFYDSWPTNLQVPWGPSWWNTFQEHLSGQLLVLGENQPPVADAGDLAYLVAVGQAIVLDGSGSYDPDGDPLSYLWVQDDALGSFDDPSSGMPVFTASQAGITDLTLTVSDGQTSDSDVAMLVVYDPSAGFVTGGGWFWSPAGALAANSALEGKASFGFVSKYKKGAEIPTGQTEFNFAVAGLDFHSSSYDWLVVTGSGYARFKGMGTINGVGGYRFMLWAGDGEPDTFRMKIWEEDEAGDETLVYDNGFDQAIDGGAIVVHAK